MAKTKNSRRARPASRCPPVAAGRAGLGAVKVESAADLDGPEVTRRGGGGCRDVGRGRPQRRGRAGGFSRGAGIREASAGGGGGPIFRGAGIGSGRASSAKWKCGGVAAARPSSARISEPRRSGGAKRRRCACVRDVQGAKQSGYRRTGARAEPGAARPGGRWRQRPAWPTDGASQTLPASRSVTIKRQEHPPAGQVHPSFSRSDATQLPSSHLRERALSEALHHERRRLVAPLVRPPPQTHSKRRAQSWLPG